MGQSLGLNLNPVEWVFPKVEATYDGSHKSLIRIPCEMVGTDIPAMLVAPSTHGGDVRTLHTIVTICVIYFHPNAVDIGDCVEDLETISDGAYGGDAILVAPEYPGYGLLEEYEPSVDGIDIVAMAAWRFCAEEMGFGGSRVMVWGRSIGCGPAASLARRLAALQSVPADPFWEDHGASPRLPIGGVVLIAPYLSIAAVVEHHTASPFLASIVGPMWDVLDCVTDDAMKRVPLCVIHPKDDDVIPSDHGLKIYQKAASIDKYGMFLSGASHNFPPEEEHFKLVRSFLRGVLQRRDQHAHDAARRGVAEPEVCSMIAKRNLKSERSDSSDSTSGTSRPIEDGRDAEEFEALAFRMLAWGGLEAQSRLFVASTKSKDIARSPAQADPDAKPGCSCNGAFCAEPRDKELLAGTKTLKVSTPEQSRGNTQSKKKPGALAFVQI
mmetsp:Transcript_79171/g.220093  ORF Transcript_79171/g.220093 Transcript_79171/m.220093 type:complete len:439 (-) Transcript_79171:249-1565(-)